ncbi:MAG TPA: magnesium/cobalt transporter CorA [Longimicrobium sp.]|nr:magnesium/cobalt transporter CorA [Longimicrobium sp.]
MNVRRRDLFRLPFLAAQERLEPVHRRPTPAPGSEPGVLVSEPGAAPPAVTVMAYGPHELTEWAMDDWEMLRAMRGKWPVVWVNVNGVAHAPTLAAIGDIFGLHRLALEDLGDVRQRAKVEAYGEDTLFVIVRMARLAPELDLEQVGVFLGRDFVVTFQERPGDVLDPLRQRIRTSHGRARQSGPDYLAYSVIDTIVDHYFPVAEAYADRLDALEEEIVHHPSRDAMTRLHTIKRELMSLRRAVWPMRDALNQIVREPGPLVTKESVVYFRDTADHCFQVLDLVETYRDLGSSLTDLYLSNVSNRMNEIMKVLTVFAAIFIPLGFITGIYGMDVDHPTRAWWWSLPFVFLLMGITALLLLGWFARKGWLGEDR